MSFLENAISAIIKGKKTVTKPIFIKEFTQDNEQLKDLIELSNKVVSGKKRLIDRDIILLKYGIAGEENVNYEIGNSFIPMLCLHDIRLQSEDYIAQLDFVLITYKFIYVLETKKLNGDIEINADGDFIRTIKSYAGKTIKKEGMYSPITQNERHVKILKDILVREKIIKAIPIKSAVIIANPKTIMKKTKCPKVIQNLIYKYDQLTTLLNTELRSAKNDPEMREKLMYEIAEYLVENNKPIKFDNKAKYSLTDDDFALSEKVTTKERIVSQAPDDTVKMIVKEIQFKEKDIIKEEVTPEAVVEAIDVYNILKAYRLKTSRDEGIKPYMVFSNAEMETLIKANPKSKSELHMVKGFGDKKVEKYGEEILEIIKNAAS
ncbi:NERD domain-containing protein [Clostridium estertheticum]|uniref:HRDC domain-containing protein n=1 Tax=Clostridium estertheticum TaxID=238834 RepID=UPI001CF3B40D|nr:HRDC domain-containing protein [Clostridium estertheticum]MCB2308603.1 NERD domain-containing protein [Clostridium estertheticum]MCB2344630.1 NERD domain-containing protein [Clostridium estertheticum]MCB2351589.1 NERD domain-containing protein [Clostridium estertheticum]WAG45555.1 NERD domain-containing protein [Clostridium estertheticum]